MYQSIGGYHLPPCQQFRWIKAENTSELFAYNTTNLQIYTNITQLPTIYHFLMGAWFVGNKEKLLEYADYYMQAMTWYFFSSDRPNGTMEDQYVMLGIACTRPDLVEVLRPTDGTFGHAGSMRAWFYYLEFARGG